MESITLIKSGNLFAKSDVPTAEDMPEITITRTIIYKGPEKWVRATLEKSLPDGKSIMGPTKTITLKTI